MELSRAEKRRMAKVADRLMADLRKQTMTLGVGDMVVLTPGRRPSLIERPRVFPFLRLVLGVDAANEILSFQETMGPGRAAVLMMIDGWTQTASIEVTPLARGGVA